MSLTTDLLDAIASNPVDPAFAEVISRRELRIRFDPNPEPPTGFGDLTERSGKGVQPPDGDTEECV